MPQQPAPPIACALPPDERAAAQARYAAAARHYTASVTFDDATATLDLRGDQPALRALLGEMVARESACCPFLTFALAETLTGYRVRLALVPDADPPPGLLRELVATLFPAGHSARSESGVSALLFEGPATPATAIAPIHSTCCTLTCDRK